MLNGNNRRDRPFPRRSGFPPWWWIYGLHAPDGGQADLAAADAVGGAHGAHAGKRTDMGRIAHFRAVEHGAERGAVRHGRFLLEERKNGAARPPRWETAAPSVAWSVAYGLAGTRARMDAVIDGDLAVDEHVIDAFRVDTRIFKRIHIADAVSPNTTMSASMPGMMKPLRFMRSLSAVLEVILRTASSRVSRRFSRT